MTTVWNGTLPAGTSSTTVTARTDGMQIHADSACELTGVWYYVPAGETNLAGSGYTAYLWSTANGIAATAELASQAGSGTFTAGTWNFIQFASPVSLSAGSTYVAAISHSASLQFVHNYFSAGGPGAGGVTAGPITVPGTAGALNNAQEPTTSSAGTFPNTSSGTWYGIDVTVTTNPVITGSGAITASSAVLAGTGSQVFSGAGGVSAREPALAGTGEQVFTGAGGVSASEPALAGTGEQVFTGAGSVSAREPVLAGAAAQTFTGRGAITAAAPFLAGTGNQRFTGSGGVTVAAPELAGYPPSTYGTVTAGTMTVPAAVAGTMTVPRAEAGQWD